MKDNWDLISLPCISENKENMYRVFQTMKLQVNNLFKENEKINKNLNELKKTDRMNNLYKNVINKFGEQIDHNRKVYKDLNQKQIDYVKELEIEKEQLLEALYEEKEKSRIDYNKLEELSEEIKKHKNFEKEISLSGYLKRFDKERKDNDLINELKVNSYLTQYLK